MTDFSSKWLVETGWLNERLGTPGLAIIDASFSLPGDPRKADEIYREAHIPGALFFDIDEIADTSSALPHMLPAPEKFASRMRKMGVGDGMKAVIYDNRGIFSAPRVWWTFRVMGHADVAVLNGGLLKWREEGRSLEAGPPALRSERHFTARRNAELVRDLSDLKAAVESKRLQILDARSKARFEGHEPEPRPVPRLGHMPGAQNLPYDTLINANGTLKSHTELQAAFEASGVNPGKPIITTCGSGVTACILALSLAVTGNEWASVYDGSWAEWSADPSVPVVQD
ncbi:MAG: 3-mercaptopyruvate sulfurtransferase [Rhodomicrobium sp.]